MGILYDEKAKYYDLLYSFKDYEAEAQKIMSIANKHKTSKGNTLLDVASGTGNHIKHFTKKYECTGVDLNKGILNEAKKNVPNATFIKADMTKMDLGKKFDVITCLFSSIGYVQNEKELQKTMQIFSNHLREGGVLIIEPWFTPNEFKEGTYLTTYDGDVEIARVIRSTKKGNKSVMDMHFLIGEGTNITRFNEPHEMTLFTNEQYLNALKKAGLSQTHDEEGITGRGLYICVNSKK